MTLYQESLIIKSRELSVQADMMINSAERELNRTGNIDAKKIERIAELNYKAQSLKHAAGGARG